MAPQADVPLRAHWLACFDSLPPDARVLDLGTGNGVLPHWLLSRHPQDALQCDAVDAAAIAPTWAAALPPDQQERLRFHGRTPAEQLPWAGPTFDVVISQFGAEYGDLARIWDELARVCRPDARLHMVMHHPQSRPCTLAAEEIGHIDWLLDGGWLAAARAMTEPMGLLARPGGREKLARSTRWGGVRQTFDAQQAAAQARMAHSSCPDVLAEALQAVAEQVFRSAAQQGHAAGLQALDALTTWLEDCRTRLLDMRAHAQPEAQMKAHAATLRAHHWLTTLAPLHDGPHLMGWALVAQRAA